MCIIKWKTGYITKSSISFGFLPVPGLKIGLLIRTFEMQLNVMSERRDIFREKNKESHWKYRVTKCPTAWQSCFSFCLCWAASLNTQLHTAHCYNLKELQKCKTEFWKAYSPMYMSWESACIPTPSPAMKAAPKHDISQFWGLATFLPNRSAVSCMTKSLEETPPSILRQKGRKTAHSITLQLTLLQQYQRNIHP